MQRLQKPNSIVDAKAEIEKLKNENCAEDDVFFQAIEEVLLSIFPLFESDENYTKNAIIRRLITPDRVIKFNYLDNDYLYNIRNDEAMI